MWFPAMPVQSLVAHVAGDPRQQQQQQQQQLVTAFRLSNHPLGYNSSPVTWLADAVKNSCETALYIEWLAFL